MTSQRVLVPCPGSVSFAEQRQEPGCGLRRRSAWGQQPRTQDLSPLRNKGKSLGTGLRRRLEVQRTMNHVQRSSPRNTKSHTRGGII